MFRLIRVLFFCVVTFGSINIQANASPHLVFDPSSGRVLDHKKAFDKWHPASLTKMMTAYTVFREIKSGKLTFLSPVRISQYALSKPPTKMGFPVGTIFTIDSALKMILVKSANDVSTALAESVGGTEPDFVDMMNANAKRLGMLDSNFVNPHGLHDDDQYTSARDLAVLAARIYEEFPQYADFFSIAAIKVGRRTLRNHNSLLYKYEGAIGMKTGYVCASGTNIVVSYEKNGKKRIAVVLGHRKSRYRNILAAELISKSLYSLDSYIYPKLGNFKPWRAVNKTPVNLREWTCGSKRRKPIPKDSDNEAFMFDTTYEAVTTPITIREERAYLEVDKKYDVVFVPLNGATGPDPFGLIRPEPLPEPKTVEEKELLTADSLAYDQAKEEGFLDMIVPVPISRPDYNIN